MPALTTPEQVIIRTNARALPQEYFDLQPMLDCAGFSIRRRYPADSAIGRSFTRDGQPIAIVVIQFIVEPSTTTSAISQVRLPVFLRNEARRHHRLPFEAAYNFDDPNGPTPEAVATFEGARKPLDLIFTSDYFYDAADDQFQDDHGHPVTPQQMLDRVYNGHCRTMSAAFSARWTIGTWTHQASYSIVQKSTRFADRLLFNLYDMDRVDDESRINPFHQYQPRDFRRQPRVGGFDFFGLQSSPRAFASNVAIVSGLVYVIYRYAADVPFIDWIHDNDALTTAALILMFVLVDLSAPWLLIRAICLLSRLRPYVLLPKREVRGV